jgi:hypothetical protein
MEHKFRAPAKRPSATVSSAFTVIVLLPLGVLAVLVRRRCRAGRGRVLTVMRSCCAWASTCAGCR